MNYTCTLTRHGCAFLVSLATATIVVAQPPPNGAALEAQYLALIDRYKQQIGPLIDAESQRVKRGAEPNPGFWNQIGQLAQQFDQEFLPLFRAAEQVDPPEALRMYVRWQRVADLAGGPLDTSSAVVGQIQGLAGPEGATLFEQAIVFKMDTLAKRCNGSNGMDAATEMVGTNGFAELVGGDAASQWLKDFNNCAKKATLLLDFESTIDATYGANGYPSSKAHVRADKIPLRYNEQSDELVALGVPLRYDSYEYTLAEGQPKCETATPESGTVRVYAKRTKSEGEPEYLVQIFPEVSEKLARVDLPRVANPMGSIAAHRTDNVCNHTEEETGREHLNGFELSGGARPFLIVVGNSDVLLGEPWELGRVHYGGSTIVRLYRPEAPLTH